MPASAMSEVTAARGARAAQLVLEAEREPEPLSHDEGRARGGVRSPDHSGGRPGGRSGGAAGPSGASVQSGDAIVFSGSDVFATGVSLDFIRTQAERPEARGGDGKARNVSAMWREVWAHETLPEGAGRSRSTHRSRGRTRRGKVFPIMRPRIRTRRRAPSAEPGWPLSQVLKSTATEKRH